MQPIPNHEPVPDRLTDLLNRATRTGERWQRIGPVVDRELRRRAAATLRQMTPGNTATLQPEELVAEFYLRLLRDEGQRWISRKHFFSYASAAMRSILIDRHRSRIAVKRPAPNLRLTLGDVDPVAPAHPLQRMEINLALDRLRAMSERQATIVELRFFAGMENAEIAALLGVSEKTVQRDWITARAWLFAELSGGSTQQ